MNRFTLALAAAAISATAATGAMALQAVGDDRPAVGDRRADFEKFAACLRANGANIPTDLGDRLGQWLSEHKAQISDAARRCKPDRDAKPGVAPEELLACLRAHGLEPPTAPDELKMWILRTPAARVCVDVPKEAGRPPDCGAGQPEVVIESRSGSAPS